MLSNGIINQTINISDLLKYLELVFILSILKNSQQKRIPEEKAAPCGANFRLHSSKGHAKRYAKFFPCYALGTQCGNERRYIL